MENKKEYLISVKGIQEVDGVKDSVELTTVGNFMLNSNGNYYIGYKEYDEENPSITSNNVVKVEGERQVTIIRNGGNQTRLILEKDRRHQCHYRTVAGDLMIGVFADTITNELTEKGGKLHVGYELDFNNELVSRNEFYITVEEKE